MQFSILHISDIHREPDEVSNECLLESLDKDFTQFNVQNPNILRPSLCIVSGDLVSGVRLPSGDAEVELNRQYAQAEEFLIGLADRFFGGNRNRVVILPGNHDVCFEDMMGSVLKIDIPDEPEKKAKLVAELFTRCSKLRWSWRELCFFRIVDEVKYRNRFRHFAATYERFYQGQRTYPFVPEQQFDVFDFPDLNLCVLSLNSCFNNDPFRRVGDFNPDALTAAMRALRQARREGWLAVAAWHHNLEGRPTQEDFLDAEFLQLLIDAGVSIGFHGHQHLPDCFDERYRLGKNPRKITIVSASTLCSESHHLRPGTPRSYNIVEIDTDAWSGRVHQRQMINKLFNLPVWGPGHFNSTNSSIFDFELCKPLLTRTPNLDSKLSLEMAEKLLGTHQWSEAADILSGVKDILLARPLLVKALEELGDARRIIDTLWPPLTSAEAVLLGGAILECGTQEDAAAFIQLELASNNTDASIREILQRIKERRFK